jgi:hypothetical protein
MDWVKKALAQEGFYSRDVQAYAVLAMAQQQLHQPDASRASLAKANETAETKLPKAGSDNLGASFHDWFIAHILLREAQALTEGTPQPGPERK